MPFLKINPPSPGSACSICFGIGKPFGNVVAPSYLACLVDGVTKGELWSAPDGEPANGTFKLTSIAPCTWQYLTGQIEVTLIWSVLGTELTVEQGSIVQFSFADSAACIDRGDNDLVLVGNKFGAGEFELNL